MPSSSRQNPALSRYSGRGAVTTAIAPRPDGNWANSAHADSVTTRQRAAGTVSSSLRMPSRSSADSTTIKVSGAPYRSQYAAMTCSPSSTQRPALRRSREDATSRAASLRRGLSRELTRGKRLSRGIGRPLAGRGRARRRVLRQLKEHFVLPDHAQLRARPLFDGFEPLFKIPHLGVELRVARLELGVDALLRLDLVIELPHPQPTAFAQPHRILQGEDQCHKDEGKESQNAVSSIGG